MKKIKSNKFSLLEYFESRKINFKNKILLNAFLRKSPYLKNPIYINNIRTNISIHWLKNKEDVETNLWQSYELDYHKCFFINAQWCLSTVNHKISYDIIVTDLAWNVKYIYEKLDLNKVYKYHNLMHIFFFTPGFIKNYNINLNDKLCVTQQK